MVTGIRTIVVSRWAINAWNVALGGNFVECWKHSVLFLGWCLHKCICLSKLIKTHVNSAFYCM